MKCAKIIGIAAWRRAASSQVRCPPTAAYPQACCYLNATLSKCGVVILTLALVLTLGVVLT